MISPKHRHLKNAATVSIMPGVSNWLETNRVSAKILFYLKRHATSYLDFILGE